MKKAILFFLFFSSTLFAPMTEEEIQQMRKDALTRAQQIRKELEEMPSLQQLRSDYRELLKKSLSKEVADLTGKKTVKEALRVARDYEREEEFGQLFRVLQDENVAEAYRLFGLIKDLRRQEKMFGRPAKGEPPVETPKPAITSTPPAKPKKVKQPKKETYKPLSSMEIARTYIVLPGGAPISTQETFDLEKMITNLKTDLDMLELARLQYQLALYVIRRISIDMPEKDFGFRPYDRVLDNEILDSVSKDYLLLFTTLAHMLNYTEVIKKALVKGDKSKQIKTALAKAIIGIHRFLLDIAVMQFGWDPKDDEKFVQDFAQGKTKISAVKKIFRKNFEGLLNLLMFFSPESKPTRLSNILDPILLAEQTDYYKPQKKGEHLYIPTLYYPDDLDEKIIQMNKEKGSKDMGYYLNPYLSMFRQNSPTETVEHVFGLFETVKILPEESLREKKEPEIEVEEITV